MEISDRTIKLILIFFVCVAIGMQIKLYHTFLINKYALDSDPLVYSAVKYNIESCECFINNQTTIAFDKNSSRYIISKTKTYGNPYALNLSWGK